MTIQSLPMGFENMLSEALPESEVAALLDSLDWPALTCVRLNPHKSGVIKNALCATQVPWCNEAIILKQRPSFIADPAFHGGYYYVQEASSSIIGYLVQQLIAESQEPVKVLDLCAAPGGKSTHIASNLRLGDVLVANEVIQSRTPILAENLTKWGLANHIVTKAKAVELGGLDHLFSVIVADMPCSGEGMFRKDPDAREEWSKDNVQLCSTRQMKIAHEIWPTLQPGGYFIYSTCTYNKHENEDNVNRLKKDFDAELLQFEFPQEWMIYEQEDGMYRLMPHRTPGEGFFFSVLRKKGDFKNQKLTRISKSKYQQVKSPFEQNDNELFIQNLDHLYLLKSQEHFDFINLLNSLPGLYSPGTAIGKILNKRHETLFKPECGLALLANGPKTNYEEIVLNDTEIISFLKREALQNPNKKTGLKRVIWKGISLGYVNGVNHNFNNLWPLEWRIRKEGLSPESILNI